jgi:negative regulator of replication initiation
MPSFEQTVRAFLDQKFPCCALSNIPIFRPDAPEQREKGYEIDHLLHVRSDIGDRIVLIECKGIPIIGDQPGQPPIATGKWQVQYPDMPAPKDVKRTQLLNHASALCSYLHDYRRPLVFEAWCVSSYDDTPSLRDARTSSIHFRLLGKASFAGELARLHAEGSVLRVEQSALLGDIRKGVAVRDMGHPELNNAIAYVGRCRKSIDVELFRLFEPRRQRWAINGTAGMGKSVLLAYALFVFAADRRVAVATDARENIRSLGDFSDAAREIGLPLHGDRVIYAMAKKDKQLQVLEHYWELFAAEYSQLEEGGSLRFQRPIFQKWRGTIPEDCNVLLIDESHDLDSDDQVAVATWLNTEGATRYLAIACDRHQKLRLVGTNAVLIEGLSFTGQTKKLRRNYRNPFPVYAVGLALMFRWLAASGPKIVPTRKQLEEEFGFEVAAFGESAGGAVVVRNWNDSHPGNFWSFTTSSFFSCQGAYAQLANAGLTQRDVLWVRFREEEEGFDYEKLLRFTYHNVHTGESFDLVDKYVKGQEFPVVVIEGFPRAANCSELAETMNEAEKEMWKARRQLYLCCSRSTAFLYFILPSPEGGQFKGLAAEILDLVKQVSTPESPEATTKRIWRLQFYRTNASRAVDDFLWEGQVAAPPQPPSEAELDAPVTVRKLATALNVDTGTLFTALFAHDFLVKFSTDVVPEEMAREIALQHGVILRIKPAQQSQPQTRPAPVPAATQPPPRPSNVLTSSTDVALLATTTPVIEDFDADLDAFLRAPGFPRFGRAVDQYLAVLTWLVTKHPQGRKALLNYRRGSRRYFATTVEEIEKFARSPNPKRIGSTGLYALTTTDTATKREITAELLRHCGIGLSARERAVSNISR